MTQQHEITEEQAREEEIECRVIARQSWSLKKALREAGGVRLKHISRNTWIYINRDGYFDTMIKTDRNSRPVDQYDNNGRYVYDGRHPRLTDFAL